MFYSEPTHGKCDRAFDAAALEIATTTISTLTTKTHDGLELGSQAFDTLMKLHSNGTSITSALDVVGVVHGCSTKKASVRIEI